MEKIQKGDKVTVIAGRDKGKQGTVLQVLRAKRPKYGFHKKTEKWISEWRKVRGKRLIVENINLVTKHIKANPQKQTVGKRVLKESGIHISNVALLNPTTGKPDKVGIKILEDGKKVRYFKSNGELVNNSNNSGE